MEKDIYHYERLDQRSRTKTGHAAAGWAVFAVVVGAVSAMLG